MSYLDNIEKILKDKKDKKEQKKKVFKPTFKQSFKQNENIKQDTFEINPEVKTINDIPNTNIMTSGKLIGVRLRANKKKMLEDLRDYINNLLESEKND